MELKAIIIKCTRCQRDVDIMNEGGTHDCLPGVNNWAATKTVPERIANWIQTRLGTHLLINRWERAMRVLEEAMELAQSEGVNLSIANQLLNRVYSRPPGRPSQELAGVQVCLHAMAYAQQNNLEEVTLLEVDRIERMDPALLQAKHDDKAKLGLALYADKSLTQTETAARIRWNLTR